MYGKVGDAVVSLIVAMAVALVIFVPLGLWKLVEIVIWIATHVSVRWQ